MSKKCCAIDNSCVRNTAMYKIKELREYAADCGIELLNKDGKMKTRVQLCSDILELKEQGYCDKKKSRKPSSPKPPSSPKSARKPSPKPSRKPSSPKPSRKPSSPKPARKPSPKPSSPKPARNPSSPKPARKPSSPKPARKPSSPKPASKPSPRQSRKPSPRQSRKKTTERGVTPSAPRENKRYCSPPPTTKDTVVILKAIASNLGIKIGKSKKNEIIDLISKECRKKPIIGIELESDDSSDDSSDSSDSEGEKEEDYVVLPVVEEREDGFSE